MLHGFRGTMQGFGKPSPKMREELPVQKNGVAGSENRAEMCREAIEGRKD